jgi:hypothetical protein
MNIEEEADKLTFNEALFVEEFLVRLISCEHGGSVGWLSTGESTDGSNFNEPMN